MLEFFCSGFVKVTSARGCTKQSQPESQNGRGEGSNPMGSVTLLFPEVCWEVSPVGLQGTG